MIVDRRLLPHMDWPLLGALFALTLLGLATIYSVSAHNGSGEFWRQVYALPVASVALVACLMVDYRSVTQRAFFIYGGVVLLLVYVFFFGARGGGSERWIRLAGFSLQPSEFGRIAVALVLAGFFGEVRRSARTMGELAFGAIVVAVPAYLIYKQPDLGAAAMLIPVYLGVIAIAGMRLRWLVIGAVCLAVLSPLIWRYGLQPYQKTRIETFLDPSKDARGKGFHQIQAKITVGSGGLFGKGFLQGTQGSGGFLPEAHNDFVFSVFAEEHGFMGVLVALALYLFVLVRSLSAAQLARDRVGALLVVGIVSGFGCQVLYNITMSAGLAPVKGLTLPLMSYGGSSLVATFAAFGLILNVRMRRFTN